MAGYSTPSWLNNQSPALNAANMTAMGQAIELAQHPYGECSTASSTAAKTVTVDFSGTLSLFTGLVVRVKFTNANSASAPTLAVNGTAAKAIKSYGTTAATTWKAGQVFDLIYDGTYWLFDGVDAFTKDQTLSAATAVSINTLTGTVPATPDDALSLLTARLAASAQLQTGSYTGTGSSGKYIDFNFPPKLVIVSRDGAGLTPGGPAYWASTTAFLWVYGQQSVNMGSANNYLLFTLNGNRLSWSSSDSNSGRALNANGYTYHYIAIG